MPAKNVSLEEIAEETVRQIQPEWRLLYPEENKPKALITTCFTGIGTAVHLSELLEKATYGLSVENHPI